MRKLIIFLKNIISIPYRLFFTKISILAALQDCKVDKSAAICSGVKFYRSEIGKYSYIGNKTFITDTKIGNFCSIAGNCYIGGTTHPLQWVSTSSVFHKWDNILHKNFSRFEFDIFKNTEIGNDVWIGEGCKIKAGVHIANGAVVGMGSVVTKNIGAYEIWGGNPAHFIRNRFSEEIIQDLNKSEWWNFNDEIISKYAQYMQEPEEFLKEIYK